MGLDTNLFSVVTNPIDKLVKDVSYNLVDTAENAVVGELSSAFQRIGLGSGSNKSILGNLGEQVLAGIAGEIFGAIGREMNISSKTDIEDYRGVLTDSDSKERDNIIASQISKIGAGKTVKTYTFPPDLNDFYVQLDFKEYRRPAPSVPASVSTLFSIALPLPRSLEDKHDISYSSGIQTGIYGMILNQGQNGSKFDGTALAILGREVIKGVTGEQPEVFNLISQQVGAVFNNHVSASFEQPTLRRHGMSWLLAANNPNESETIRQITKLLKGAALPAFSRELSGEANINILTFPLMCKITLMPWGDVPTLTREAKDYEKAYSGNMYTFKHCVIESIKVNYSPSMPAFFSDDGNAPAFVGIEMSFLELEYFTADDFGRKGRNADFGKADLEAIDGITGLDLSLSPEERKAALESKLSSLDDGSSGDSSAQAESTNNFNANSAVVRAVTPTTPDAPDTHDRLYQTADGSWYRYYSNGGVSTVTPIDKLDDPIFTKFGVYTPSIADAPTASLKWPQTGNVVLIKTGSDGKLQMGTGTP